MAPDEETAAVARADLDRALEPLRAHRAGAYLNFEEHAADPASFYEGDTYRRLRAVRAAVDPGGLFRANHVIPPAS
jgi:FAD/FMN-containing dehydrogenase